MCQMERMIRGVCVCVIIKKRMLGCQGNSCVDEDCEVEVEGIKKLEIVRFAE